MQFTLSRSRASDHKGKETMQQKGHVMCFLCGCAVKQDEAIVVRYCNYPLKGHLNACTLSKFRASDHKNRWRKEQNTVSFLCCNPENQDETMSAV